jgi:predicted transcriptional regulator of viral defense system
MNLTLGPLETQALTLAQSSGFDHLEAGALVRGLGWTAEQERKVMSRLARKGLVVRVRRGLYLVPPRLPVGGRWSPGEFAALKSLIDDRGGKYQLSGPSAFNRYGWTEQIPNRLYAYNNRLSGDRQVGPVAITLIKVADDRLGGTELVRTPDNLEVLYASRPRALVDAVYDWSRFNSLPQAYRWIELELVKDDALAANLVHAAIDFGNQGTLRRIGACLEMAGVPDPLLRRLERELRTSTATIPYIPNRARRGPRSSRWGVVLNVE